MDMLEDECPICTENNLALGNNGVFQNVRLSCCGTLICKSCIDKMQQSAIATDIPFSCPICRTLPAKYDKENFDRCMNHAKNGRPWAQEMVAQCYLQGIGVTQSDTKAFEFYSLAAAQGLANSQSWVGKFYREGRGVAQSHEKALPFFQKAAEQGLANAQFSLGFCYQRGYGVEESLEKAFHWFLRAAEKGNILGNHYVGICYYYGDGIEKDCERAVHHFTFAAKKDYKTAQFNLATCFANGEGVKQSFVKAIYWLRQCLKDNKYEEQCADAKENLDEYFSLSSGECSSCGHRAKLFLKCSKCLSAYYCNVNCQKKHWKNGHKQECKEP